MRRRRHLATDGSVHRRSQKPGQPFLRCVNRFSRCPPFLNSTPGLWTTFLLPLTPPPQPIRYSSRCTSTRRRGRRARGSQGRLSAPVRWTSMLRQARWMPLGGAGHGRGHLDCKGRGVGSLLVRVQRNRTAGLRGDVLHPASPSG